MSRSHDAEAATLVVVGEVDMASAPLLREHMLDAFESGARDIVFDLSAVGFIDSTGLSVLAAAYQRATAKGGRITVVTRNPTVHRLLQITGLDQLLTVEDGPGRRRGGPSRV